MEKHTVRVGRANKSEFKVACIHCRGAGIESQFVSRTDAVIRHLNQCQAYQGPLPTLMVTERVNTNHGGAPATAEVGVGDGIDRVAAANDGSAMLLYGGYHGNGNGGGLPTPQAQPPATSSNGNNNNNNNKRRRRSMDPGEEYPGRQWISRMERQVLRALVSTGSSFNAVEDIAFRGMLENLCPTLQNHPELIPTKASLSGRILMEADRSLKTETLNEISQCKWVTLTVDCWKNCAQRMILGYVLRTPTGRSLAWEWNDVTNTERVSYETVVAVARHPDLAAKVAGVVITDSARRFLLMDDGSSSASIIQIGCYDQDIRSMLGDCLLALPGMRDALSFASTVTRLLRDSPEGRHALGRARRELNGGNEQQDKAEEDAMDDDPLRTLLQYNEAVSRGLYILSTQAEMPLFPPNSGSVDDGQFITLIHAACELTGALSDYRRNGSPKLRMVLPAAYRLWTALDEAAHVAGTPSQTIQEVKYTLNSRLQSWDLRLLILSTIFDPAIKRSIFNPQVITTPMAISLCEEAYRRLFFEEPSQSLVASFLQYLQDDAWPFSDHKYDTVALDTFYWSPLVKSDHPELARLALRLESCVVDMVDPEKLFDEMGRIHAALRSSDTATGTTRSSERVHREANKDPETLSQFLMSHEQSYGRTGPSLSQEFTFETLFAPPEIPAPPGNGAPGTSSLPLLGDHDLAYD